MPGDPRVNLSDSPTMGRWTPVELERYLQRDVLLPARKRWSLAELASQGGATSLATPCTSQQLLQCVVHRLALQHQCLTDWSQLAFDGRIDSSLFVQQEHTPATCVLPDSTKITVAKRLDTLRYIHADTFQLGRQLLSNKSVWERFSQADKHVVNASFLEIRARHANALEAVVDIVSAVRLARAHMPIRNSRYVDGEMDLEEEKAHGTAPCQDNPHERIADIFCQGRLGIQLLCDHHVELYKNKKPHGGITKNSSLPELLNDAILEAQHIVDVHLQIFPEAIVTPAASTTDLTCTVVQPWLHFAVVELLKNGMASAVTQMKIDKQTVPPPIAINVVQRNEHCNQRIGIDIIDQGTGVRDITAAFALGHSSIARKWDRLQEQQSYAAVRSPLSSLGVGLPVSCYMLEHFGGSLTLENNIDRDGRIDSNGTKGCIASISIFNDETLLERIPGAST